MPRPNKFASFLIGQWHVNLLDSHPGEHFIYLVETFLCGIILALVKTRKVMERIT